MPADDLVGAVAHRLTEILVGEEDVACHVEFDHGLGTADGIKNGLGTGRGSERKKLHYNLPQNRNADRRKGKDPNTFISAARFAANSFRSINVHPMRASCETSNRMFSQTNNQWEIASIDEQPMLLNMGYI
jgi:hypothetical protein